MSIFLYYIQLKTIYQNDMAMRFNDNRTIYALGASSMFTITAYSNPNVLHFKQRSSLLGLFACTFLFHYALCTATDIGVNK